MTPMKLWMIGLRTWQMQVQAATVMNLRLAGMAGAWVLPPAERNRMVLEKQKAFTKAGAKATEAVLRGAAPFDVYEAALRPVGRVTKANSTRLSRAARRS